MGDRFGAGTECSAGLEAGRAIYGSHAFLAIATRERRGLCTTRNVKVQVREECSGAAPARPDRSLRQVECRRRKTGLSQPPPVAHSDGSARRVHYRYLLHPGLRIPPIWI